MEGTVLTEVILPAAIALIMFGMGLSLTAQDFYRLFRWPKPIAVGLVGQILLLPLLAYVLCIILDLSPIMAAGLMILSACPGGTMSNVISQLARANLALSVTLTGFSTLICLVSTPLIIQFVVSHFLGEQQVSFSIASVSASLSAITLIPISLGMLVRNYFTEWAIISDTFFRRFSALFMAIMIALILWQERATLSNSFNDMFLACLLLNLISMTMGIILARVFAFNKIDAMTLSIEVGIQNATLAILIAMTFLQRPDLAVAAGVYGITMYIGGAFIVFWSKWPAEALNQSSKHRA